MAQHLIKKTILIPANKYGLAKNIHYDLKTSLKPANKQAEAGQEHRHNKRVHVY